MSNASTTKASVRAIFVEANRVRVCVYLFERERERERERKRKRKRCQATKNEIKQKLRMD